MRIPLVLSLGWRHVIVYVTIKLVATIDELILGDHCLIRIDNLKSSNKCQ